MNPRRSAPGWRGLPRSVGALLLGAVVAAACGVTVRGRPMPVRTLAAAPAEFDAPSDVVVLHSFGAGGWGVRWRDTFLVTAPYFSDHSPTWLAASEVPGSRLFGRDVSVTPELDRLRVGFAGTPIAETQLILVGHGHVDHAGDIPGYFEAGMRLGKPALVADRSVTNMLTPMLDRFSCVAPIDYGSADDAASRCPVPHVRVTPIHSAHAPHVHLGGLDVAAYGGSMLEPAKELPRAASDFRLGNTWAFLIDLLDDDGRVAFRIHYVDAATSPPHAIAPARLVAERDVDVHIACVASSDDVDEYPEAVLRHHNVRYVLGGHWEDFLQPQDEPLRPLRFVVTQATFDRFVGVVERTLGDSRGVAPLPDVAGRCARPDACGPRGATWAIPMPGETFRFRAGPQPPAAPIGPGGLQRVH